MLRRSPFPPKPSAASALATCRRPRETLISTPLSPMLASSKGHRAPPSHKDSSSSMSTAAPKGDNPRKALPRMWVPDHRPGLPGSPDNATAADAMTCPSTDRHSSTGYEDQ